MNVKVMGDDVYVFLSVRNAKQLLEANEKGFATGIIRNWRQDDGDDLRLHVLVEDDADHYKDREAGPGLDRLLVKKGN